MSRADPLGHSLIIFYTILPLIFRGIGTRQLLLIVIIMYVTLLNNILCNFTIDIPSERTETIVIKYNYYECRVPFLGHCIQFIIDIPGSGPRHLLLNVCIIYNIFNDHIFTFMLFFN